MEATPRLSNRLLAGLYQQNLPAISELKSRRKFILQRNLEQEQYKSAEFVVERFLTDYENKNTAVIRTVFKNFVELMATLTKNSMLQKDASLTMYNIMYRNREDQERAFQEAVSYFGHIERPVFDLLWQNYQELALSDRKRDIQKENLSQINFQIPRSVFQPTFNLSTATTLKTTPEVQPQNFPVELNEDNEAWLYNLCKDFISKNRSMPFDGLHLSKEILKICQQKKSQEELEMKLFELVGENGFDLLMTLVPAAGKIQSFSEENLEFAAALLPLKASSSFIVPSTSSSAAKAQKDVPYEALSVNQKKKLAKKEQKEVEEMMKMSMNEFEEDYGAVEGGNLDWLKSLGFNEDYLNEERRLGLQKNRNFQDTWTENLQPAGTRIIYDNMNRGLPAGSTRNVVQGYEEIYIPAPKPPKAPEPYEILEVAQVLEPWAHPAFAGTTHLNRIQSAVYKCAYHSFENMLVCAPTGAGKTNIAMLTILQLVKSFVSPYGIDTSGFKIIYIAPMKALAQEVVTKFTQRLAPLGIVVKEYTGDMQLSKQEIAEAQILVCTPEKYDVSTRKGGDGSLITMVNLIIIDEIHLLADERGAVLETIVARTQRYVETSQKLVRIVGLSATLPNYHDVATFLRVNPVTGLHFFGSEYRPIPLDQTFLGVTEKNRIKKLDLMNRIAYEKCVTALEKDKQIMIFVHSRRETSKTLDAILEIFAKYNTLHLLDSVTNHDRYTLWKKQVDKSKSTELQNFFAKGVGIHHAGMLRADRTLTEQLFENGLIKILCCTSTLSWGVNLPAHTVIIKGTELYDPSRGGFIDISILDVLQIFGRAGRPQYDNSGHAILITSHKSLYPYLGLFLSQTPIESAFIKSLADHLNAEIVNGTVNNVREAMNWVSYTFLFIRMKKNPLSYGMKPEELYDDPQLEKKRKELIHQAAEILDSCMMIRYDYKSGNLAVTDLGRVASYYYLKYTTIEGFNTMLSPFMSDVEAIHLLTSSSEFNQLKLRPEELNELDTLQKHCSIRIKMTSDEPSGKVSILLQAYLNHMKVNSFTLQSDINYISQNASRITRALFEICIKRSWSSLSQYYLTLSKCIEYSVPIAATPLRQFGMRRREDLLPTEIYKKLEEKKMPVEQLKDLEVKEIGQLIQNQRYGQKVYELLRKLPKLAVNIQIQPISKGIIRLNLSIQIDFEWSEIYHGLGELFHFFVEDNMNEYIYHYENIMITKQQKREPKILEIMIPVKEPLPSQYYLRILSDKWINCDNLLPISFQSLFLPTLVSNISTDLLNLHPVPIQALQDPFYEQLYANKFHYFNPIQSQIFHTLYYTDANTLVGAPTGSGKTIIAELAILRLLKLKGKGNTKIIYIAPLKALAKERLKDWQLKFQSLSLSILELTGEFTPDLEDLKKADILIVTPEKWDSISRGWQKRDYVKKVDLVIIDEIHLLGIDRGPVLEVIVSRMRFIATQMKKNIRFIGLSTALANARDLADWLGIEEGSNKGAKGLYNFKPSVRPVPITIHIQGFPGKHYCPRMATMNKPCYAAILEHSPNKPVLIFVSSRRQTRLTALDLISFCASDDNPKKFLHMPEEEMEYLVNMKIKDRALKDLLLFGIGIHHAGLENNDRELVEELFLNNKIQVLVCTSTLAWGVNLPCHLVIVKGTEYFDAKSSTYVDFPVTDILQMMGRAGRPQFDDSAVACIFVQENKKNFYRKFLHEPFPVESSLHKHLTEHLNAEICNQTITNQQDVIEYLTWTYFFRRLIMNPSYYSCPDLSSKGIQDYLIQLIHKNIQQLKQFQCISIEKDEISPIETYKTTTLGVIASYYYLNHKTPYQIQQAMQKLSTSLTMLLSKSIMTTDGTIPMHLQLTLDDYVLNSLLMILSNCLEYSEIPLRHNEENLNLQLAIDLQLVSETYSPYSSSNNPNNPSAQAFQPIGAMTSAHTKVYLLFHAFLKKAKLPITDYINDTKMVMDQSNRIINAMIDIAGENNHPILVFYLIYLLNLLHRGLNHQKNLEFSQFSFFTENISSLLQSNGYSSLSSVMNTFRQTILLAGNSSTIVGASPSQQQRQPALLLTANNVAVNGNPIVQLLQKTTSLETLAVHSFLKRVQEIPIVSIAAQYREAPGMTSNPPQPVEDHSLASSSSSSSSSFQVIPLSSSLVLAGSKMILKRGQVYELEITLSNLNYDLSMKYFSLMENWWILLLNVPAAAASADVTMGAKELLFASHSSVQLLAMKKLGKILRAQQKTSISFQLPAPSSSSSSATDSGEELFHLRLLVLNDYIVGSQLCESFPTISLR